MRNEAGSPIDALMPRDIGQSPTTDKTAFLVDHGEICSAGKEI